MLLVLWLIAVLVALILFECRGKRALLRGRRLAVRPQWKSGTPAIGLGKDTPACSDEADPMRLYSLHINFRAGDSMSAKWSASQYIDGLKIIRPEVHALTARISAWDHWSKSAPVYCLAAGPQPDDLCLEAAGHDGRHFGNGPERHWTDTEVPDERETTPGRGCD